MLKNDYCTVSLVKSIIFNMVVYYSQALPFSPNLFFDMDRTQREKDKHGHRRKEANR